jgi:uncharacterized membrane protein YhhN
MKKNYPWSIIFLSLSVLHLLSISANLNLLGYISKPLLMPALLAYFWFTSRRENIRPPLWIYPALVFSWAGDIFLMIPSGNELWFILGIAAFLIAQGCYLIVYGKSTDTRNGNRTGTSLRIILQVAVVIYAGILWVKLYPSTGNLAIPVTIYTLAITGMVWMAMNRYKRTSISSFFLVGAGALFFLFSDSLIAIHKFLQPVPYERILIMSTYLLAQWLIIKGLLIHFQETTPTPAS